MQSTRRPLALLDTPPVWLAGALALAWAQSRWWPLLPGAGLLAAAGWGLIASAVLLFADAALRFVRARTTIVPREVPRVLLSTGAYGLSRNPIYLADALLLAGCVLLWDLGGVMLVPVFVLVITFRFILGEEAVCAATFGEEWKAYAARVRRWL
jgi:protein-S-isoprenylcysteine O-methyltransferase Ste14